MRKWKAGSKIDHRQFADFLATIEFGNCASKLLFDVLADASAYALLKHDFPEDSALHGK
jgi:hypothetical protein